MNFTIKTALSFFFLLFILQGCKKSESIEPLSLVPELKGLSNDTFILSVDGKEVIRKSNYQTTSNPNDGIFGSKFLNYLGKTNSNLLSMSMFFPLGLITVQGLDQNNAVIMLRYQAQSYNINKDFNIKDDNERFYFYAKYTSKRIDDNTDHLIEIKANGIKYEKY
jgi:hypothetical protein